jgi:hypothetical protein
MNGQPSQFDDYPTHGVVSASGALVRAWSALENFHSDLVVVGGLAIHFHTRQVENPLYRPTPTLDVDFGMTLAADAGLAAPAAFALMQAGFRETEEGRMYLESELGKLFVDFLTEHPLAHHDGDGMLDVRRIAGVGEAAGELFAKAVAAIHLAQQQDSAVTGEMPAGEVRLHAARTEGLKSESLLATLCHRPFCFSVRGI